MSDDELEKYSGSNLSSNTTPSNSLPYPASRLAPAIELVDMAREIAHASQSVQLHTNTRLKLIAKQIKALQEEAHSILKAAQQDQRLHQAECRFKKQPGQVYHLYQRSDQSLYFSMLSPSEWHNKPPHEHQGSFRLEADMSWTEIDKVSGRDEEQRYIEEILHSRGLL